MGEEATTIISDELGEGPFHILRDNYISVYQYEGENTARELVDKFLGGELPPRTDNGKSDSNTQ